MEQKIILALDVAESCGYAVCKDGKVIKAGVWDLSRKTLGKGNNHALYNAISGIIEKYGINRIVKEAVYMEKGDNRKDAAVKALCGYAGVVSLLGQIYDIPVSEIKTWQTHNFIFKRVVNDRAKAKAGMCRHMQGLGYQLPSKGAGNVAHALCILFAYVGHLIPATTSSMEEQQEIDITDFRRDRNALFM